MNSIMNYLHIWRWILIFNIFPFLPYILSIIGIDMGNMNETISVAIAENWSNTLKQDSHC